MDKLEREYDAESKQRDVDDIQSSKAVKAKLDSVQSLFNNYRFDNNVLSLYRNIHPDIKIYKLVNQYFIKIEDRVYRFNRTTGAEKLYLETDKNILNKIGE